MIAPVTEPLEGIAGADALLGRPFPLPAAALPLTRWVDVSPVAEGAEVVWSLDDSRPGTPGRLALYAGRAPAPPRDVLGEAGSRDVPVGAHRGRLREHPLSEAQPSLRPVREVTWQTGDLALRLTAQGPWDVEDLLAIAASVTP
jgi:hypothetical protein